MKNTFKRFKQFILVPLWLVLAILQFVAVLMYIPIYWLRIFLLEKDTKAKFAHPKLFLNRVFEATDLVIFNPAIKTEIKAEN